MKDDCWAACVDTDRTKAKHGQLIGLCRHVAIAFVSELNYFAAIANADFQTNMLRICS